MILSHQLQTDSFQKTFSELRARIIQAGAKPYVSLERLLALLEELTQFELGRFVLQNGGLDGYWTHYLLTYKPQKEQQLQPLEDFFLNKAPSIRATQERFKIFLQQNQLSVRSGAQLASIPCGLMGELLYLDFSGIDEIKLWGIDLDPETLKQAKALAEKRKLSSLVTTSQEDAWDLAIENTFDLISSNGLNIYERDDERVTALYRKFYQALAPAGRLVTSFLTYPPLVPELCEWDLSQVDLEAALLQRIIFSDLMNAKWQCFRTSEQTRAQLQAAGFQKIEFIYDAARIFPTVVAEK